MTKSCFFVVGILAFSICKLAQAQNNTGAILTDGDDAFSYGANVTLGVSGPIINLPTSSASGGAVKMNFNVGDALQPPPRLQRAFQGNWFYRIQGDSRERNPANMSSRILTPNEVEYQFPAVGPGGTAISGLTGKYGFILNDTGPNSSLVTTHICFINNTQTTFTIDTFLAVDLDLLGTFGGDFSLPTQFNNGRLLTFKEGGDTGIIYGPGAIGSGVGLNSDVLSPLANNPFVDNFPDFNFGATPDDLEGVVQFQLIVPPGQEICAPAFIGIGINNENPVVPEPAGAAGLAVAVMAFSRKHRRS